MPDASNIAVIGQWVGPFPKLKFMSDANLAEYGTIILDPQHLLTELSAELVPVV